ncbi:uncharacterized protein LOC122508754 isoform X1 [Leptopilina heterotoma]|uniref:uncharacterized protein LOC122508754 isoform X1 n=1 Tax=Leptopilina heterotoma TaxID=63436 RepID=UPI001CA999C7|nr:uncharacterized protein LOC122508754 isoform X1 [Leptopilina heterotoma]XP_043478208.1 uncharacterized protein LOC122508754 isoform X1 [Leptopilina heterotoma]
MENLLMTPSATIDEIEMFDSAIEVIGYIVDVSKKCVMNQELLAFTLANGEGRKISCVAWGTENVNRLHSIILKNKILQIKGAVAHPLGKPEYQRGNAHFLLYVKMDTTVTSIGQHINEF